MYSLFTMMYKFVRRSPHHRAPIDYHNLEWLTVPVRHTGHDVSIDEARIDMTKPWPINHLKTLIGKYGKDAEALRPFYERLCPFIIDIGFLRENPDDVAACIQDTDGEDAVRKCLRWDAEWRARKREEDKLRNAKGNIRDRISERKQKDSNAEIADLIDEVNEVEKRLEEVGSASQKAKRPRNETLVRLSRSVEANTVVERAPLGRLWDLDGIDPTDLVDDRKLVELTVPLLKELFRQFDVTSKVVRSSELDIKHPGDASEYLARLTEHFDGDYYLSGGIGYENYVDLTPFDERGYEVIVQDWTTTWEAGNVCALDVLFGAEDPGQYIT